jgi:PST family polysaccharide transporter
VSGPARAELAGPAPDHESAALIARKASRGAAWNVATSAAARLIGLLGTLVLARFIAPEAYGQVIAAVMYMSGVSSLFTINFGQYIVARRASPEECFTAAVYHLGLGLVALALVIVFGDRLGAYFHAPTLGRYLPGLVLAGLVHRVSYVPERLLARSLRFRTIGLARAAGEMTHVLVSLALVRGIGGMAIVVSDVARALIVAVILLRAVDRSEWLRPVPILAKTTRALFGYGAPLSAASLADFFSGNADTWMVSRFWGPGPLALFNFGGNIVTAACSHVVEPISEVLMPSFSRLQREDRVAALTRSAALMTFIGLPLGLGIALVGDSLIRAVFDPRWYGIAPFVRVIGIYAATKPIYLTLVAYNEAQQRPRLLMAVRSLYALLLVGAVAAVAPLGAVWIAFTASALLSVQILAYVVLLRVFDGIPVVRFLRILGRPAIPALGMVALVLLVQGGLRRMGVHPGLGSLVIEVGTGLGAFFAIGFVVARSTMLDLLRILRAVVRR